MEVNITLHAFEVYVCVVHACLIALILWQFTAFDLDGNVAKLRGGELALYFE